MKHAIDGKRLTAYLVGKIDSSNAPEVERELFALIEAHPGSEVVLDADGLAYTSSAGLRALLRVQRRPGPGGPGRRGADSLRAGSGAGAEGARPGG